MKREITVSSDAENIVPAAIDMFYELCKELALEMTNTQYFDFLVCVHAILTTTEGE